MSRYIEIDTALLKTVTAGKMSAKALWRRIMQQPSIDICFCRECKHWSKAPKTEKGWCDKCDGLLEPNFFCADGEREGE